jgi:hypothetical protein
VNINKKEQKRVKSHASEVKLELQFREETQSAEAPVFYLIKSKPIIS